MTRGSSGSPRPWLMRPRGVPVTVATVSLAKTDVERQAASLQAEFGLSDVAVRALGRPGMGGRLRHVGDEAVLQVPQPAWRCGQLHMTWTTLAVALDHVVRATEEQMEAQPLSDDLPEDQVGERRTAGAILHAILDQALEQFFPVLDQVDDEVASLERDLLRPPAKFDFESSPTVQAVLSLKRQLLRLRRALSVFRDSVNLLQRGRFRWIDAETGVLYAELYDHVLLAFETLDTQRDLLASALECHLSSVANRMNGVVKSLTVLATLLAPLTFVSGIYGMNFPIPETHWRYGYFFALGLMAVSSAALYLFFKRRRWL